MRKYLIKILPILLLLITISTVNSWTNFVIGNTTIWYFIYILTLFYFIKSKQYFYNSDQDKSIFIIYMHVFWMVLCVIRGCFEASGYWEWKHLTSNSMFLLMPLSIFVFTNKNFVQKIIYVWLKYALPAFFVFYFFIWTEAFGRYLIPISFLLLFFPILPKKWKFIFLFFSFIVFVSDLTARSNVIKFAVPILLSCIFYVRKLFGNKILEVLRSVLLFSPFLLFVLAVSGVFNIFNMKEYMGGEYLITAKAGEEREGNLTIDTRTFLYLEVLESAIKNNYVFLGRTPARGNDSNSFGAYIAEDLGLDKNERPANEVSILNIFTWSGLLGVVLYFFIFYKASYLAVHKSNNIFIKIVGLYVAFRWLYAWVEDFSRFNLANIYLWIAIGMCFSSSFRAMSNKEFTSWLRVLLDKRYRVFKLHNSRRITTNEN